MANAEVDAVIDRGCCYPLQEFARRARLGKKGMRRARQAGLRVIYRHGRGFVLGADWIEYLERSAEANGGQG